MAYRRFSGKDFASDDLKAADRLEDQYMSAVKNVLGGLLYLPETEPMRRKAQLAAQLFKDFQFSTSDGFEAEARKVVTGAFTVNQYKVTFVADGVTVKEETLDYGTAIIAPEAPEKEGYTFSGWSEIPATMPAEDVTVVGTFSVIDGISSIGRNEDSWQIYTIDGKRINTLQKGLNILIKNGVAVKKVMVK